MTKWCAYKDGSLHIWWAFDTVRTGRIENFIQHNIIQQDETWYEWDLSSLIVISDHEFWIQEEYGWYHFKRVDE